MKTADVVAEFVRGRPSLEQAIRKAVNDPFAAPEVLGWRASELVHEALREVSDDERVKLDRVRGQGKIDWLELALLFVAEVP